MESRQNTPTPQRLNPLQFTLQQLFILTTAVAVCLGLLLVVPWEYVALFLLFSLPFLGISASILGVIYLSHGSRAFCLGFGIALVQGVVVGLFMFAFERHFSRNEFEALLTYLVSFMVVPLLCGMLGVYFYRLGQANKNAAALAEAKARQSVPAPHSSTSS